MQLCSFRCARQVCGGVTGRRRQKKKGRNKSKREAEKEDWERSEEEDRRAEE